MGRYDSAGDADGHTFQFVGELVTLTLAGSNSLTLGAPFRGGLLSMLHNRMAPEGFRWTVRWEHEDYVMRWSSGADPQDALKTHEQHLLRAFKTLGLVLDYDVED